MPELPEVETVRLGLMPLEGAQIRAVKLHRTKLRYPLPENFALRLVERRIQTVQRVSKYLLLALEGGGFWMIHLGMSGQCRLGTLDTPVEKHDHVLVDFTLAQGKAMRLVYRDPRRFGMMDLIDDPAQYAAFARMGREAIFTKGTADFARAKGIADADYLCGVLGKSQQSIKTALLDQRLLAGLGNIYVLEALWRAEIAPQSISAALPKKAICTLSQSISAILLAAMVSGGSSLRDFVDSQGKAGYFQHDWQVYQRAGQPCRRCGGVITRVQQSGRSSFYCPDHQLEYAGL